MKPKTQKSAILDYLKKGNAVTPMKSLELFGCYRLSAIIHKLRSEGNTIKTNYINFKSRYGFTGSYASYVLVKAKKIQK